MTFKPVDFSEEKAELQKQVGTNEKGSAVNEPEEIAHFKTLAQEIDEFILSAAEGMTPFLRTPIQSSTLICTKVLGRLRAAQTVSLEDVNGFIAIVKQDLGEPVSVHIEKMIFGKKK